MFQSREEAGTLLAEKLKKFEKRLNTLVIGITRGGVVVAKIVAHRLKLPLDVLVVRKIGAPTNPELAIGAVGPRGVVYWDDRLCHQLGINKRIMKHELRIKERERKEREKSLRGGKRALSLKRKTTILVDDGVATGATVLVAKRSLKKSGAKAVVLAVPVIAKDTLGSIKKYFDSIVALSVEEHFYAVGQFYEEFPQVSDNEVVELVRAES